MPHGQGSLQRASWKLKHTPGLTVGTGLLSCSAQTSQCHPKLLFTVNKYTIDTSIIPLLNTDRYGMYWTVKVKGDSVKIS